MSLIDNIAIPVSEFHAERIRKIDDFDYGKVAKKVSMSLEGVTPSYVQQGIENLKLYYVIALLDPLNAHAVSKTVDPFWHAHILFTKDYINFCDDVFGQYIQHDPLDQDDSARVAHIANLYDYTLSLYGKIFKQVNPEWWPPQTMAAYRTECGHMEINTPAIRAAALFQENPQYRLN